MKNPGSARPARGPSPTRGASLSRASQRVRERPGPYSQELRALRASVMADPVSDYLASLSAACSSPDAAPRPEVMDNTAHVASCSMAAAPGILAVFALLLGLRRLLCPQRLRTTYSGAEDAPELEAITGDGKRRVDGYDVRAGRLATARPKPKSKRKASETELEPVVHGWKERA